MNRTALSVVALAVGSILILGLYNIYKPQTNSMVHDVFNKVHMTRMAGEHVPITEQAKDHHIDINNPQKPFKLTGFEQIGRAPSQGIDFEYVNAEWTWKKSVSNKYIGYWYLKPGGVSVLPGETHGPSGQNLDESALEDAYFEKPDGSLVDGSNPKETLHMPDWPLK